MPFHSRGRLFLITSKNRATINGYETTTIRICPIAGAHIHKRNKLKRGGNLDKASGIIKGIHTYSDQMNRRVSYVLFIISGN